MTRGDIRKMSNWNRLRGTLLWATGFMLAAIGSAWGQGTPELRVAAAADLTKAFGEVATAYQKQTGQKVTLIFGASGQLTQQIEHGAPYDVFAAANENYLLQLEKQGVLLPGTRQVYAQGRLVLWTRKGGLPCPKTLSELTNPRYAKIAIANPQHAPYGMAAREALQSAGVWNAIQARLVYGENIQQTYQFASTGNADVAILSLSLAREGGNLVPIPDKLYKPLRQALGVLKSSTQPQNARQFTAFVLGKDGSAILKKYGFTFPLQGKPK